MRGMRRNPFGAMRHLNEIQLRHCQRLLESLYLSVPQVTELWQNNEFAMTYSWIQNILRSIVPLLIMSALNCFIVDALRRSARHVAASSKTPTSNASESSPPTTASCRRQRRRRGTRGGSMSPRNRRITIMLVAVIVVFIVCVTPDAILSTVFGFGYYDEVSLIWEKSSLKVS